MRLFIAEKPSMGKEIAKNLGGKMVNQGPAGKPPTHIEVGGDVVTWGFGHLLEMAPPEHYSEAFKKWSFDTLPIEPKSFELLPKSNAKAQISTIKALLKKASTVVNAGDPDREGQWVVDSLLEHFGNTKPVQRIILQALDEVSVKKALANLQPNTSPQFIGWKNSAIGRQRSDWFWGMNLTRAHTLVSNVKGQVVSIGRVQTPTLGLVVARDLAIENFKPKDFYAVSAQIVGAEPVFSAKWKPSDAVPVDESGRVLDANIAQTVCAKIKSQTASVTAFEAVDKKQSAPLPYSLSSLQLAASKKLGLGAQRVLDIAQTLYEQKLTSYPRTDCPYLPESQHASAELIAKCLPEKYSELVKGASFSIKSGAWNDSKVTAHHGIIPTGQKANLSGELAAVYDMIVLAYLAQFYPPFVYKQTTISLEVAGEKFTASGKAPISQGWKVVFGSEESEEGEDKQTLPVLQVGQSLICETAQVDAKKTTPPLRFTEGTLIQAMTNVHQLVDDPEIKKRLKETAGIGTEATRANIIETLKMRKFIEIPDSGKDKGKLVSTQNGRKLIAKLPDSLKSAGITGLFEQALESVAKGETSLDVFMEKQTAFVKKYVEMARKEAPATASASTPVAPSVGCPVCEKGKLRLLNGSKGAFWGCSGFRDGCKTTCPDLSGKPDLGKFAK
ncbi:DNA topoisomerase 3 [Limnobacter sp. MED105]|uniref:DNA topoisomerase 3 n=1 Tax=Limnobacter sp. MED105 TaxID=391597 RepID=UPI000156C69C|nr:DNA topoisomerase 3 [Limnobacter sp. MED105]EDM82078.1 DNA topoisomerase III [Limnobacter sp. MED105]